MHAYKNTVLVLTLAISYYAISQLNSYMFSALDYSYGVTWISLPSGLRLAFVLVLGGWGALGIAIASAVYLANPDHDIIFFLGSVVISGLSPVLALWICKKQFKLDLKLSNLSSTTLLKMCAIFAIFNPVLHQAWFFLQGQTKDFVSSTLVMITGDFIGTLIMLYLAKLLLFCVPSSLLSK